VLPPIAATAEDSGYQLSYRLERTSVGRGQPVLLDVSIKNTSSRPVGIDLGGNGNENIVISIINPDGRRIDRLPTDRRNRIVFFGGVHLGPQESYRGTLVLNQWFEFGEEGSYVINIGLKSAQAPATLHLEVKARDATQLASFCSELLSRIQANTSAQDSLAAVQALSYVRDPVAVSAWGELLRRPDLSMTAISNLADIGGYGATKVLISRLGASDEGTRSSIRSALQSIARNTPDEGIRREIGDALSEPK